MDLELRGKTAVVTGGSRGIGKAVARQLAMEGVDVAIVARNLEALSATALELTAETGQRVIGISADTGDDEAVRLMARQALAALGHIDILVNCAAQVGGATPPVRLGDYTFDTVWPDMNIKVMGYLRCIQALVPSMRERGWGRVISIGGLAARRTGSVLTTMRNAAIVSASKNLADELGPLGINVYVVHPGGVRTERTAENLQQQAQRQGITPQEVERRMAEGNTVHKLIDARDIANVVAFLASPKSIAMNGEVIAVGGGTPGEIRY